MKDVSKLFENNSLDTLVREYSLDVITYKMLEMYSSEDYKNSNQPIEDLVTIEEIVNYSEVDESFVRWLIEIGSVYYRKDCGECYFNLGEIVDKHDWYQWCEKYGESF